MAKRCRECKGPGPFYRDKAQKDGLDVICRECRKRRSREREARERDLQRAEREAYGHPHKSRRNRGVAMTRRAPGPVTILDPDGAPIVEAKEDDTDGRLTGRHECFVCSMRYNDLQAAVNCCAPALEAHHRGETWENTRERAQSSPNAARHRLLSYLREHGEVSVDDAGGVAGVKNASSLVDRMRKSGHRIETRWLREKADGEPPVSRGFYVLVQEAGE